MSVHQLKKYDFSYSYKNQTIPYRLWTSSNDQPITTVFFLGNMQIGKLPEWIAKQTPPGTIVIQGVPHWLADENEKDISPFVFHFTKEVFATIFETFKIDRLRVIAESQAAPGVLAWLVADKASTKVTHLALLQPLGFTADMFVGTEQERMRLFKRRIAKNFRYQLGSLIHDPKLRYNHRLIIRSIRANKAKGESHYASGLSHDATQNLSAIANSSIHTVIICGKNDMMFPPKEIKHTLQMHHISTPIHIIPGVPHSPPATKKGTLLVSKAFAFFETN